MDREKIYAIRKFLNQANDDLVYLAERMDEIMGMFIFQVSRRQVLDFLVSKHDELHRKQDDLASHDHEDGDGDENRQHEAQVRHNENILKAVHAAEEHIHKLEYWSDQRGDSEDKAIDANAMHRDECGSKGKQVAHQVEVLRPNIPEQAPDPELEPGRASKSIGVDSTSKASNDPMKTSTEDDSSAPGQNKLTFFDAHSNASLNDQQQEQETPSEEVFVEAAESVSDIDGDPGDRWVVAGKADPASLDGVPEEAPAPNLHGHSSIVEGDELQELVPESEMDN
jgi:hypothetical protein